MKHIRLLIVLIAIVINTSAWAAKSDVVTSNSSGATVSFSSSGSYEWEWDSTNQRLRSTNYHVQSSTSQTTITISNSSSCDFSFDYAVSSESSFDKLTITLDGSTIVNAISGTSSNTYSGTLSGGSHSLVLKYSKDGSQDSNDDRGYLSNMKFISAGGSSSDLSGTCGTNVQWSLDSSTGVLSITGSGPMDDYAFRNYAGWYDYRSNITHIEIASGINYIGKLAFYDCTNLQSVSIPSTVLKIGRESFYGCSSLESVSIPSSVQILGMYAFANCTSLKTAEVPSSVVSIEGSVFIGCDAITEAILNNTILFRVPTSVSGGILVPNTIKRIDSKAFENCVNITSFSIPSSVTYMGSEVFYGCSGDIYIDGSIPSVTYGDYSALHGSNFTSVTFGPNATVGNYAFYDNRIISKVVLPTTMTELGEGTFYGCTALSEIEIPASVSSIGKFAFRNCTNLKKTTVLCEEMLSIGDYAFEKCSGTLEIHGSIPAYKSSSSNSPFYGSQFSKLIFAGNNNTIGDYAFGDNHYVTSIEFNPNSVSSIGAHAFSSLKMVELILPEGLLSIGSQAFFSCNKLTKTVLPSTLQTAVNPFEYCTGTVYINSNVPVNTAGGYPSTNDNCWFKEAGFTKFVIADGVETIGEYAFQTCRNATSFSLPNSIKEIGYGAFSMCTSLTDPLYTSSIFIKMPKSITGSYIIPSGIKEIYYEAFMNSKLTSITIPKSVTKISTNAFNGCQGNLIAYCDIDDEDYYGGWFYGSKFSNVTICEGVKKIGSYAFNNNVQLSSLSLPSTLETISDYAFCYCSNINDVFVFSINPPTITSNVFANYGTLHVYKQMTEKYSSHNSWKNFTIVDDIMYQVVTGISFERDNYEIQKGQQGQLSCSVSPQNALIKDVKWSTEDDDIISIDENSGQFIGLKEGVATIKATAVDYYGYSAECTITVSLRKAILSDGSISTYSNDETEDYDQITYTRNFKNTGWQALYVPFEMSYDDWKNDFDVAYIEGFLSRDLDYDGTIDEISWSGVMIKAGTILPNTPYLIRAKSTGMKTITLNDATLYATEINSIDCSSTTMRYDFIGQYESESYGSDTEDWPYYMNNGAFSRVSKIIPFRWIMRITSRGNSYVKTPDMIRGMVRDDDGTSFIEYVESHQEQFRGYKVFTLDGRMIDTPEDEPLKPGFYIKNGKKILIR